MVLVSNITKNTSLYFLSPQNKTLLTPKQEDIDTISYILLNVFLLKNTVTGMKLKN